MTAGEPRDRDRLFAELADLARAAGLTTDPEPLLDALWLARFATPRPGAATDRPGRAVGPRPGEGEQDRPRPPAAEVGRARPTSTADAPGDERVVLGAPTPGIPRRAVVAPPGELVRLPRAPTVPDRLPLTRALRPLRSFAPAVPRYRRRLDVDATVTRMAETGVPELVMRREPRRDLRLHLVIDATPSMVVWHDLLQELRQICTHLGAFHEVRVEYLHAFGHRVATTATPHFPVDDIPPAEDDDGADRIRLLLSDCTGAHWGDGRMAAALAAWSRRGPLAVLQPLPQRLWARTRFPATAALVRRSAAALGGLTGHAVRGRGGEPGEQPIPVLEPTAGAMGAWARLLAGPGAPGVRMAVGWLARDGRLRGAAPEPPGREPDGPERVALFRRNASPAAYRLAVSLTAAPLWMPVMKLVQRAILPQSGPAELAEVLLGGLVQRRPSGEPWRDGPARDELLRDAPPRTQEFPGEEPWNEEQWYAFRPGVREVLLDALSRDEALLVQKYVSAWLVEHVGGGARNYPAIAAAQLQGVPETEQEPAPVAAGVDTRLMAPFAEVSRQVVRRYLAPGGFPAPAPAPAEPTDGLAEVRALLSAPAATRRIGQLIGAVELLRPLAVEGEARRGEAAVLLAEALLALWGEQGDPGLLDEADEFAVLAEREARAVPERLAAARLLGARVLHTRGGYQAATGDRRRALWDLRYADQLLAGVLATDEPPSWAPLVERGQVLFELWQAERDAQRLDRAEAMLRAALGARDAADAGAEALARARALLGRVLLERSRLRVPPDDAMADALLEQAYDELGQALAALAPEPATQQPSGREQVATGTPHAALDRPALNGAALDRVETVLLRSERFGDVPRDRWYEARTTVDGVRRAPADGRTAIRAELLTGRWERAEFTVGRDPAHLREAARRFDAAAALASPGSPERAESLAERVRALLDLATETAEGAALAEAVVAARAAAAEAGTGTGEKATEAALLLAEALLRRHQAVDDPTDLREAEYVVERAAEQVPAGGLADRVWSRLAQLRRLLYRRHGVERWRRLAEEAEARVSR
ncbi:SAV_2336 N-terminal domain-related protein [Streptacidiphilus jiangxiensis]|uniref:Metallophosphoesterase n=1 Tax=Streptacidiphilus jiangxiensis TaxID=235985 RepID=A0A1H7G2D9_STRJI|nr:SAV_2336 N-terminal domain-related protein [Streptacidiphilus jiangxiensis]SEK32349.1 hypothetical protein SAMN05414137_101509 [Streptacidiphilus jiangxiensis]